MAQLIKAPVKYGKGLWKGGMMDGAIAGATTGVLHALDIHPFFANLGGGALAVAMIKNSDDRRIVLVESVREAVIGLFAAE